MMEVLGQIVKDYGIIGLIVFTLCLMIFLIVMQKTSKLTFNFSPNLRRPLNKHLKENIFFSNVSLKLHSEIPSMILAADKPVKQQIYRDLLYLTINSFYHGFKNIVNKNALDKLSAYDWGDYIKDELKSMNTSYKETADDFRMPRVAIRKYDTWLQGYLDMLSREYIDRLVSSPLYHTNTNRTDALLLVMNVIVIALMADIDKLVNDDSTDIAGLTYRESIIED